MHPALLFQGWCSRLVARFDALRDYQCSVVVVPGGPRSGFRFLASSVGSHSKIQFGSRLKKTLSIYLKPEWFRAFALVSAGFFFAHDRSRSASKSHLPSCPYWLTLGSIVSNLYPLILLDA